MATEKQMDELIEAVNDIAAEISNRENTVGLDDINIITTSLWRIAEALERMSPPPPKKPLTPKNNYWARKRWEKEHGRIWTDQDLTETE